MVEPRLFETRPQADESADCDTCGRFGAIQFGDRKLCPDCYESSGSCCPEFGREQEPPEEPDQSSRRDTGR